MILEVLKSVLRKLFIESGFFYRFISPVFQNHMFLLGYWRPSSRVVDEGGSALSVTKYEGRTWPPVDVSIITGVKNLRIRPSDVLIVGYPKTGCHFVYEILHMMRNETLSVSKHGKCFGGFIDIVPAIMIDSLPSPRNLNSHRLYDQLPEEMKSKKTKILLTFRNAKDTTVSYYHHNLNLSPLYGYDGKFENHFKLFMEGTLEYGSYFDYYRDWAKLLEASNSDNQIFLLRFEDLKKDPVLMIKKVAKFLEVDLTHERATDIAEASSFTNVKKAREGVPFIPKLMRKGVVGDWVNWLDEDQREQVDRQGTEIEDLYEALVDRQNGIQLQ